MKGLLPWLVAFALVAAGIYLWNREHRLRTDAERGKEAADLTLKGQIVAAELSKKDLAGSVEVLTRDNSALRDALAKAQRAAPGAHVTGAGRLDTGAMKVLPSPAGFPNSAATPSRTAQPPNEALGAPSGLVPQPAEPDTATVAQCVLAQDDQVSVEVNVVELTTRQANTLIVGTAEVFKQPGKVPVAIGDFQSTLSGVQGLQTPTPPRWGALALGACGRAGCGPGAGVLFPPWWKLEGFAGLVAPPGGLMVLGGVGWRF